MRLDINDPRLMDYVLGELEDGEARDVAAALEDDENKDAREVVDELRGVTETTRRILREEDAVETLSDEQRAAIVGTAEGIPTRTRSYWCLRRPTFFQMAAAALFVVVGYAILTPNLARMGPVLEDKFAAQLAPPLGEGEVPLSDSDRQSDGKLRRGYIDPKHMLPQRELQESPSTSSSGELHPTQNPYVRRELGFAGAGPATGQRPEAIETEEGTVYSTGFPGVSGSGTSATDGRLQRMDLDGSIRIQENYYDWDDNIHINSGEDQAWFEQRTKLGTQAEFSDDSPTYIEFDAYNSWGDAFAPQKEDPSTIVEARNRLELKANLKDGLSLNYQSDPEKPKSLPADEQWAEYNVGNLTGQTELPERVASNDELEVRDEAITYSENWQWYSPEKKPTEIVGGPGSETYVKVAGVKPFVAVRDEPLSTFSIDVDTAAYSNVRRFLNQGQLPPPDAVRIEEMINYFAYAYPQPVDGRPFAVAVMGAPAPWDPANRLVRIGIKGKEVPASERPPANLVFLLDVSGSMSDANKLPLVKESMKTLLGQLRPNDRVGIVTYAGNAQKVLDPTPCSEPARIAQAIDSLQSGGSTNGGGGIQMAYDLAQASFIQAGINRVIIATDGDFNVGTTAHGDLMSMIEARAKSGVFLTALGFGMGNLKDSTLEQLADRGNGNYAYIDNHAEARRALVDQLSGTLQTIAKDVKIQVEFNPALVSHYRLLGYENRALANQDFNDDTKDAGEIGAGHTVTALYEIIPVGGRPAPGVDPLQYQSTSPGVDALKYQQSGAAPQESIAPIPVPLPRPIPTPEPTGEWLTVKMRYKEPQGNESTKLDVPLTAMNGDIRETDADFRFASAVAAFGQVLRHSGYRHPSNFDRIVEMARAASNGDVDREAFVDMVITAKTLTGSR